MHRPIEQGAGTHHGAMEAALRPRVLVVEDDPGFAALLSMELQAGGYDVTVVGSVVEARRSMCGARPALILSDVRLPGGAGTELLRPKQGHAMDPPVLMMSAFVSPELRASVEEKGARILDKPFSFGRLHANVLSVLMLARRALSEPVPA